MTEKSTEQIAIEISEGVYLHNSGGDLNSTVGKSIRFALKEEIKSTLDTLNQKIADQAGELERLAEYFRNAVIARDILIEKKNEALNWYALSGKVDGLEITIDKSVAKECLKLSIPSTSKELELLRECEEAARLFYESQDISFNKLGEALEKLKECRFGS
jgi:hypothetical protein